MPITVSAASLPEVRVFVPEVYEDDRGLFKETYSTAKYKALGLDDDFVQDSVSYSSLNVIRGLHGDPLMSKFVQVLHGRIWDVVVDARPGSATYGRWEGFVLSQHNHRQLYVPPGFLHGFLALTDDVVLQYKHGALYDAAREFAVRWDDPTLAIAWPLAGEPRISRKDQSAGAFRDL